MSFGFPPKGWALCDGQILPINQNQGLFSLLGTTYGGDGRVNFRLPDLRARTPIHMGSGHTLGEVGGQQSHTLTISEIPAHIHIANATSSSGGAIIPTGNLVAGGTPQEFHAPDNNLGAMNAATLANTGGSQPHQNMQPFLALTFSIALQGIFPSRN